MMYCAECGDVMTQNANGTWVLHCNGLGYWYNYGPLERDKWWTVRKVSNVYFYPTVNWPIGKKPTPPNNY